MATEVWFYHLERHPLKRVLPTLLERTLERKWRAVVQFSGDDSLAEMDTHLWTFNQDSFLPHGTQQDGRSQAQPVFLTTTDENPNGANIRFMVDGADLEDASPYERVIFLFDGRDDDAVRRAREQWSLAVAAGHGVTYWRQSENGRWEKQA